MVHIALFPLTLLVNLGGGTYEEAKYLIDLAKEKIKAEFGIELELKVQVV